MKHTANQTGCNGGGFRLLHWRDGLLPALIAIGILIAWLSRFVQDDAFISFRYAQHLAEGQGLVWNAGERVEGYTNFLWTVCLTPAFRFKWNPILYSHMLSLMAFAGTLWISAHLAIRLTGERAGGWMCVFLLITQYSFLCYATGGLETQFVTLWTMLAVRFLIVAPGVNDRQNISWLVAGLASACAVLTRMDSVLLLAPFWLWRFQAAWRDSTWRTWRPVVLGSGVAVIPVAVWLLWRHGFYGEWVPNTFWVKSTGCAWIRGSYYVGLFYWVYGYVILLPLVGWGLARSARSPRVACLLSAVFLWQGYVVLMGGDFMEFRMLIPSLPMLLILMTLGILKTARKDSLRVAMGLVLAVCSGTYGMTGRTYPGIQSVRELRANAVEWHDVGESLTACFGEGRKQITIAVTAAGIIPYETECPTVDLLGLNDWFIARHGEVVEPVSKWLGNRPGHSRIASASWLQTRGVHLLLNKPWVVDEQQMKRLHVKDIRTNWSLGAGYDPQRFHAVRVRSPVASDGTQPRVVAWPMGGGRYLMSLYLLPSPHVDEAIRRSGAWMMDESLCEPN
jgi:arabinofuranosyltransferase